ncbi:unnamed protein product [Acanthoscelides obtectus]|uniref:Uncharacterized protein n=1 Tax=Acanthoscelides obtectus TaxID=200917 RepID=A0A9P0LDD3_ACAOB|nr:unnamed protein product [Acanthoscelides obtectus]CAK1672261.1 hypothetical protein AOBTE_LOCUS28748 [Acanthoscelides obtectus]
MSQETRILLWMLGSGTENYIITAKNVLLLLAPSLSNLLDVSFDDYPDLEDIFNPSADNSTIPKPDNITLDLAQILFGPSYASPVPSSTTEHQPVITPAKNETHSRKKRMTGLLRLFVGGTHSKDD